MSINSQQIILHQTDAGTEEEIPIFQESEKGNMASKQIVLAILQIPFTLLSTWVCTYSLKFVD